MTDGPERRRGADLVAAADVEADAALVFERLCAVERWPVWLAFVRSAERLDGKDAPLVLGSEIALRSKIPGEAVELYEVDRYLEGHHLSLVGAYSLRRRLDFRIERRRDRSRVVARLAYPRYSGFVGEFADRLSSRRRLRRDLDASLVHFKGLVEFDLGERDGALADL